MAKSKTKTDKADKVAVTFLASVEQRAAWKQFASSKGKTITELVCEYLDACVSGGTVATMSSVVESKEAQRLEAEKAEVSELLKECSSYCWPCGELHRPSAQEREELGLHSKVAWLDEAGRCYDKDMYQWQANGEYSAELQVGAGALVYKRTLLPSLRAGWRPKEPVSELTRQRVEYVLRVLAQAQAQTQATQQQQQTQQPKQQQLRSVEYV